jgi:hypothetical protein
VHAAANETHGAGVCLGADSEAAINQQSTFSSQHFPRQ